MSRARAMAWAVAAVAAVGPATAHAGSITVQNPGFESYDLSALADAAFYKLASSGVKITSWTPDAPTDDGGLLNPSASQLPGEAPEGSVVLWLRNGTAVSQVLSTNLAAAERYTLTVAVASRLDTTFSGYVIQLYAGSTLLAGASDHSVTGLGSGTVRDVTVTFDSTGVTPSLLVQPLKIRIAASPLLSGLEKQTEFDNVRLSSVSLVPEPWSAAMVVGAGIAAVVSRRRS